MNLLENRHFEVNTTDRRDSIIRLNSVNMEESASQLNDVSVKEEGELSDDEDDEIEIRKSSTDNRNLGDPSEQRLILTSSTTCENQNSKNHHSSPQYISRHVGNRRKHLNERRELGPYFNRRRHLIGTGNSNNSTNHTNGSQRRSDGIPNCSDLGPTPIGGGGYWAPPVGSVPSSLGPPRFPSHSVPPWEKGHHHHHSYRHHLANQPLPSRGLGPSSQGGGDPSCSGPGNKSSSTLLRPLEFPGPWSENRRGPTTTRSHFPYWEKKRDLRRQSGSQFLYGSGNQAAPPKDDGDYKDLLEKYRNIKKQLASLREEEDRAASSISDLNYSDENANNWMSYQYNPEDGSYRTFSVSHRPSQSSRESSPNVKRSDNDDTANTESISQKGKGDRIMKAEDEDIELEELRRIALASTDGNKPKATTTSPLKHDKPTSRTSSVRHSNSFSNKFGSRFQSSARKRESSVLRDRISASSATRRRVHLTRRHQSNRPRRSQLRVGHKIVDEQRRDIYKILELEDPQQQLEKLAKFLKDRKKDFPSLRTSHSKSPSLKKYDPKTDGKVSKLLQDNYEEVAMDIDSDDGTSTVPEIEDIKIDIQRSEHVLFPNAFQDQNFSDLRLEWTEPPEGWLKLPPPPPPPVPLLTDGNTLAGPVMQFLCPPVIPQSLLPPPPPPDFLNLVTCMPPPPPPPLPEEPYPEAEKPPEPPYDEDEEEEKLLRAQLLQSIANRRKEITNSSNNTTPPSVIASSLKEDSPSSSRSQSPFYIEKAEPERKKPYYPPKVMPKQPSVVINLAEDTSDSESESESDEPQSMPMLSGLDQFLRDARKSVETKVEKEKISTPDAQRLTTPEKNSAPDAKQLTVTEKISIPDAKQLTMAEQELANAERLKDLKKQEVDLQTAEVGFRKMEEKYVKQRKQMLRDMAELKVLVTQASKFLTNLKSAEKRCEVLKENLKKSENIVKVNQQHVTKVKTEVQRVKAQLQLNQSSVLQLEKNLLQIGKRLYGNGYQPRTIAVDSAGNKRDLPLLSTKLQKPNVLTANHMLNTNNSPTKKQKTPVDIAKEKRRLELMQLEYAEKLRQLQVQAQTKASAAAALKPQPLPRFEKIALDSTDESEPSEPSQNAKPVVPMRRKSLINLNSNMKPEILQNKENIQLDLAIQHLKSETQEESFKMPETSQLTNLRKVLHKDMQDLLKSPNPKVHSTEEFNLLIPVLKSVPNLKIDVPSALNDQSNITETTCYMPYKSPLLQFRSYRFSPFFRTKENMSLTCPSFSHKLHPRKRVCNYDLLGTCNDQECTSQHTKDYMMSKSEILQDIVSYAPRLAGVTEDLPLEKRSSQIDSYVENILNQNQGRMTIDELCLLQVSKVNEYAAHVAPHTMFFEPRSWKPSQKKYPAVDYIYSDSYSENHSVFEKSQLLLEPEFIWEDVINEQDVRYFSTTNDAAAVAINDLESELLQDPHNDQLWLKLANKKLNSWESDRLDQALNVLARGLENNKQSPTLWQRYLELYSQHQDSHDDLISMCQTAIQNAPTTYSIWWLYLNKIQNYFEKTKLCQEILQFLKKEEINEKVSHHITEIIIYQVGLMVITNRYKTGLLFLKNLLQTPSSEDKELMFKLLPSDRCLLWLCYIHLYEFQQLPDRLYQPCGSHPDKLVTKTFLIDWRSKHRRLNCQLSFLNDLFNEALNSCLDSQQPNTTEKQQMVASSLYRNLFNLFYSQAKLEEALKLCLEVLEKWPGIDDMWLSMAQIHIFSGDRAAVKQVFSDALTTDRYSARLYLYAAMSEMVGDDYDRALEYVEEAVIVCFDITTNDSRCDPNILYCCLLGQTVPFDYKVPKYCDKISPEVIKKNQIYIWLCYCLLLELQGDYAQAVEFYETALSTFDLTGDIAKIWKHYLRFQIRYSQDGLASKLPGLVKRCLTSLSAKAELPHWPGHYWLNYEHHNTIVDIYINCLSSEQQFIAYDKLISIMPNNSDLILRAFDAAVAVGDFWRASAFCQTGIHERLPSIQFWTKVTSLAIEAGGGNEVQQLFMKAVRVLPYAVSLWKHFLFFEVTLGAEANVMQIIRRCKELDVNILGFVKNISR